jgi:hypothetical protein
LPNAVSFFVAPSGRQEGPYDLNLIAAKIRDGALQRSTLVWRQGMASWVAADTVPELQGMFAAVPPPLPPLPPVG